MIKINEIHTKRFILRQVTKEDNISIFEMLNDDETLTHLNVKKTESIADADEIIEDYLTQYLKGDKFPFAIVSKESGQMVGVFLIKLDLYDFDCFEFTIYLKRDFWNQGIYSEVLPYMMDFAFNEIGTNNFRGFVMVSNKASSKVLKNKGFTLEKTFSVEGLPEKIESYLMTKEDYLCKKKKNV